MLAVKNLDEEKVKDLLHRKNVNVLDRNGNTALMYLLDKDIKENKSVKNIIDMLVSAEVNLDNANKYGETALIKASKIGNVSMAEYLIGKGANVDFRNNEQKKAIHYAGDNEELRRLLNYNSQEAAIMLHGIPQDPYHVSQQKELEISRDIKFEKKILDENKVYEKNISDDKNVWVEVINEKENKKDSEKEYDKNSDEGYYSDEGIHVKTNWDIGRIKEKSQKNNIVIDPNLMPSGFSEEWQSKENNLADRSTTVLIPHAKKIKSKDITNVSVDNKKKKTEVEEDIFKNPWE